jgi:hypothetical protein
MIMQIFAHFQKNNTSLEDTFSIGENIYIDYTYLTNSIEQSSSQEAKSTLS